MKGNACQRPAAPPNKLTSATKSKPKSLATMSRCIGSSQIKMARNLSQARAPPSTKSTSTGQKSPNNIPWPAPVSSKQVRPMPIQSLTFEIHVHTTQEGFWSWRRNAIPLLGSQRSAIDPSLLRGCISACCLTSFFLNDLILPHFRGSTTQQTFMEPLQSSSATGRQRSGHKYLQSELCFWPLLGVRILAQKLVLWLHASISRAQKRHEKRTQKQALKIHNFRAMLEKKSATQAAKTVSICALSLC